ncbi:capsular polysaccharide synthesis protein [Limosilactobacillus reuteri]|uniref:capsular polysaccharide synthesis protein n=1 Tax=Limosilactobacillus reuteri TaxID=1598 RepID=UPI0023600CD7|nr:capsular polysaccharide synthesis protein [Limosilactobacillus reuteri]MDD1380275.1 capsular polysaccharide synthesis protein [Limosilactobacillus reuteri]
MKIDDYRKKVFLKLYKKQVAFFDTKSKFGNTIGYEKYFNKVLQELEPDFLEVLDNLKTEKKNLQKKYGLFNNIYVMWWQGLQNAPILIQNNIKRMQKIFGKNNVHIITQENWKEWCSLSDIVIRKFNDRKISITALSDVIRFNLLKNYGGLWIDSTVILNDNCKDLLFKYKDSAFFSISNRDQDYHYISKSRWTTWLIGGETSYPLFNFIDAFYNMYFSKHDFLIDYYTTDDLIAFYYKNNMEFKKDVNSSSNNWHPYLWSNNLNELYDKKFMDKVKYNTLYSIQKLTYKYDKDIANNKKTLLYAIINNNF